MVIHNGKEHLTVEESRLREDRKKIKVRNNVLILFSGHCDQI